MNKSLKCRFRSRLSIRTPQNSNCNSSSASVSQITAANTVSTRSDFATIFQDHDIRQPLDPNRRFCDTPGPYLGPDSMLRHVTTAGIKKSKRIHFGPDDVPFGERNDYKKANETYDVQYDSLHVRPKPPFGPFPKAARVLKLGQECADDRRPVSPASISESFAEEYSIRPFTNSYRASLVPLPKIKSKAPPKLTFDDSSYSSRKQKVVVHDLTPSYIKKEARIELFSAIEKIPRKHLSTSFPSRVGKQLKGDNT